jgi:hypothetical protein
MGCPVVIFCMGNVAPRVKIYTPFCVHFFVSYKKVYASRAFQQRRQVLAAIEKLEGIRHER